MQLAQTDIDSILWDLGHLSIFFDRPVEVEIPSQGVHTYVGDRVASTLGGLHWSLFQRGFPCTACGNCCKSLSDKPLNRRLWFWWDEEPMPDLPALGQQIEPLTIILNSTMTRIHTYISLHPTQCDFLLPQQTLPDGTKVEYCGIHTTRPSHCMMYPGTAVYYVGKERVGMLSRRLPGRNWRWPQCPVDVAASPLLPEDIANDRYIFDVWEHALGSVPGQHIGMARGLYDQNVDGPRKIESIFFRDHLGGTNG